MTRNRSVDHLNPILVGAVQVNKSFVYTEHNYECAAWWEERTSDTGVFPVYLTRSYSYPKNLLLTAHIEGKVTNDYFPALWGGVSLSNKPYTPKNLGQKRTILHSVSVEEAIEKTGNSPGADFDWFILPAWWYMFVNEANAELKRAYESLPEYWEEFQSLSPESFRNDMFGCDYAEGYRSRISMVAHFGKTLEKWARRLEKISYCSQYWRRSSDDGKLFSNNTAWAKALKIECPDCSEAKEKGVGCKCGAPLRFQK